ncbi:MAG: hypothetical protein B6U72_03220 [Candidatus Altiarchaeales archaeon ex4484_2]|nr:MAG: hypothetical protein B6U72_03220 [Candidatus Altiarchaeales archaeon ex4484_2]
MNTPRRDKVYMLLNSSIYTMMIEVLRAVTGFILVLFLPGYAFSYALFPGKEIDLLERIALSIGLSISLVVLSTLALNTLLGVAINLINSLLVILTITLASALTGYYRRKQINTEKNKSIKNAGTKQT